MASLNGINSEPIKSHANSKGWIECLAEMGRSIKDKPGTMRTVLKGFVSMVEGVGILVELSQDTKNALEKMKYADGIIKVLRVPGLIDTWVHYDYGSICEWEKMKPIIFAKDIADTILGLCSIPQLLDKLQLISLSNTLGRVPVLSLMVSLPGALFLSALNIFVASVNTALSANSIVKIKTGAFQAKIDAKKTYWIHLKNTLNSDFPPNLNDKPSIKEAYDKYTKTLKDKEFSQPTKRADSALLTLAQKKIDKWDQKGLMQKEIVVKEAINIFFNLVLITLTALGILSALALSFTGMGLLMSLLGLTIAFIGVYKLCDDLYNPMPSGISPKSVLNI